MSQDLKQKAFTYLGICPFISSENILARFKLAVTTAELTRSEVLHQLNTILRESESVIIPSHFWWRKDVRELISDLQPIASRLVIQCGPGFELKEKVELIQTALQAGFRVQIICQKRLSYLQENQIRPLLQFKAQVDIHFFVEEAADPIGDMNYFCTHFIENLSISLTKFSFGLLSELEISLFQFKFLKFYSLATGKVYTLSEAIEKTSYARSTFNFRIDRPQLPLKLFLGFLSAVMSFVFLPKIEKVIHLINRTRASLRAAHHTLKTMRTRVYWSTRSKLIQQSLTSYWSTRSLFTDFLGLLMSISSKVFWLVVLPAIKIFWSFGYLKSAVVKIYWATIRFSTSFFWFSRSVLAHLFGLSRLLTITLYWHARNFLTQVLLWPFRKAYWMIEFQYQKRLSKNRPLPKI